MPGQLQRRLLHAVTIVALSACSDGDGAPPGARIRDSAGIVIVENPDPLTADSTGWVVDTTPRVRIGTTEGDDPYMFGRVVSAVRLGDGRIAVADAQTNEVRFFDSAGVFIARVGGKGQGPGEFVNFNGMQRTVADSLLVTDYEGGRYHVLDSHGRFDRRFRLTIKDDVVRQQYTSPRLHGVFDDGSLLVTDHIACARRREPGICVDSGRFMRVRESGERVASFGNHVYHREEVVITSQGKRTWVRDWQPANHWTAHGSRFYVADAKGFEIRIYSGTGALERIVRADYEQAKPPTPLPKFPRPPMTAIPEERRASMLEFYDARDRAAVPERMPAFAGFTVDRAGNMWVREFTPFWTASTPTARWWVFDSAGVLQRSVRLPRIRQTMHYLGGSYRGPEIGDDYILGMRLNPDGADEIVMFDLRKTAERTP